MGESYQTARDRVILDRLPQVFVAAGFALLLAGLGRCTTPVAIMECAKACAERGVERITPGECVCGPAAKEVEHG
jgi:hypothetical protein